MGVVPIHNSVSGWPAADQPFDWTRRIMIAAKLAVLSIALPIVFAAGAASAEDPIQQVLQYRQSEWSDGFDAVASSAPQIRGDIPTLSTDIVGAVEHAILQYSDIVARGDARSLERVPGIGKSLAGTIARYAAGQSAGMTAA